MAVIVAHRDNFRFLVRLEDGREVLASVPRCIARDMFRIVPGDRVRVQLDGAVPLVAEITAAGLDALALHPGDQVWASVKATEIATYPA